MMTVEGGVARAIVTNIRNVYKQSNSVVNNPNLVKFSVMFQSDEWEEAMCIFNGFTRQEERDEATRIVVDSRNNKSILQLLEETARFNIFSRDQDEFGPVKTQSIQNTFETSVILTTLNNDPETLKAILDWGKENLYWGKYLIKKREENMSGCVSSSPILIASLENYMECLPLLFNAGYRIELPDVDNDRIERMLHLAHDSAGIVPFYYTVENDSSENFIMRKMRKKRLDPVNHYLVFRGHSNPLYLSIAFKEDHSLDNRDPIRKAFALSHYTKHLKDCFPEHSEEFTKIKIQLQDFTRSLLNHCNNSTEVSILLEYYPHGQHPGEKNRIFQVAVWEAHKGFVCHPYFQMHIWSKMIGSKLDWDSHFLFWKLLMIPYAILLFLVYPFIVIFDSIFRDSDILFVSPEELVVHKSQENNLRNSVIEEEEGRHESSGGWEEQADDQIPSTIDEKENVIMDFFRVRIHRPIYRMFVTGILELTFLLFLFFTITDPGDKPYLLVVHWNDIVTWYFIANNLFEDIANIYRWNWNFFGSFWNTYSLMNHLLLVTGGLIAWYGYEEAHRKDIDDYRTHFSGNHPLNVGMTLISYGASMSFFRSVRWLLLHRKIGPVLICTIEVMRDVVYICFIAGIASLAFAVGLWSMYKPFQKTFDSALETNTTLYMIGEEKLTGNKGWRGLISLMFWTVFDGEYSNTQVMSKEEMEGQTFSLEFSHAMGLTMWALYQGLTVILLINILIALMNSTYTKVWENADMEWKFSRAWYHIQFTYPRAVFPPPFRWFYYFATIIQKLKNYRKTKLTTQCPLKKREYLNLLLRLVNAKLHSDMEESTQDDFSDLKKDIMNMMTQKEALAWNAQEKLISDLKKQNEKLSLKLAEMNKGADGL